MFLGIKKEGNDSFQRQRTVRGVLPWLDGFMNKYELLWGYLQVYGKCIYKLLFTPGKDSWKSSTIQIHKIIDPFIKILEIIQTILKIDLDDKMSLNELYFQGNLVAHVKNYHGYQRMSIEMILKETLGYLLIMVRILGFVVNVPRWMEWFIEWPVGLLTVIDSDLIICCHIVRNSGLGKLLKNWFNFHHILCHIWRSLS